MTKVMWLGEDVPGPSFNTWNGIKFPKGVAVDVTDQHMLGKARNNQYYKVIDDEEMKQEDSHGESQTQGKEKVESEAKEKDYRKGEKGTGYSPVKKKVRKKKPEDKPQDLPNDTTAA
jgi:hypothetical protein